jgi:hypothetical protein
VEFLFALYQRRATPLLPAPGPGRKQRKKPEDPATSNGEAESEADAVVSKGPKLPPWYIDAFKPRPSVENRGEIVPDSLDIIFDEIDNWFCAGRFKACDRFLANVVRDPEHRDLSVLVGILTATLPAAAKLPNRARLLQMVHNRLLAAGRNADAALKGL